LEGSEENDDVHDYFGNRKSTTSLTPYHDNNNSQNTLYGLLDKTQVIHLWPLEHPLPLPKWNSRVQKAYKIEDMETYQRLCWDIEVNLQKLLEDLNYDTVNNLLIFYQAYKKWGRGDFIKFFRSYSPPICPPNLTCVGLALELWNRLRILDDSFPNISEFFFIVSCEENIGSLDDYISNGRCLDAYAVEKEHVLLAIKFELGNRQGILLSDPGYHVGRVVTVMKDHSYPHTGWFVQSNENNIKKEYNYQYSSLNNAFVEWKSLTVKNEIVQSSETALIYVSRAYQTAVDVTERRNLVYNFRSLLSRDQKGHLIAGIYFKIKENSDEFTIFYKDGDLKKRVKMNFSEFARGGEVDGKSAELINICNDQLNLPINSLPKILEEIGEMMQDRSFVLPMLAVNNEVGTLAENY